MKPNCAKVAEISIKGEETGFICFYVADAAVGAGAGAFNSGWRALTTMLMFGRNSASYCTHNAATAAICINKNITENIKC